MVANFRIKKSESGKMYFAPVVGKLLEPQNKIVKILQKKVDGKF